MRDLLPLTHPQKRIVINQQIYPQSTFAVLYGKVSLKNQSVARINAAINAAVSYFDCLRIRFIQNKSQILQSVSGFVYEDIEVRPATFDYSAERPRLFDEKLYRFFIVKENGEPSGYFFIFHHAVVDAYTVTLVIQYIEDFLEDSPEKQTTDQQPRSFLDYAKVEQSYLQSDKYALDRAFFEERLQQSLSHQYIPEFDLTCCRIESSFSDEQSATILSFCKQRKLSVFRLVYAALFLLLYCENGKTTQTVATTHHNRDTPELLQTGGMLTSTIPTVQRVDGSLTFEEFLSEVSFNVGECLERYRFPVDTVLSEIKSRDLFDLNVTEVMLNSIPFGSGSRVSRFSPGEDVCALNFKLNPHSKPKGAAIEFALDYRICRYTQAQATSMLRQLSDIVFMFVEQGARSVASLLSPPDDVMAHIQKVIADNPERIALADVGTSITYREMGERVDAVAAALEGSEQVIGIINERSVWHVVAVLGVLKAGRAFTVLDPSLPPARLDEIIRQTRVKTALCSSDAGYSHKDVRVVDIRSLRHTEANLPGCVGELQPGLGCTGAQGSSPGCVGDLAYILFTSGSSGVPKGVMVGRQSLLALLKALKSRYGLQEAESFLAFCHFCFDVSLAEIFLSLYTASTLYIADEAQRHDLKLLEGLLHKEGIDHVFLPTRMGELFIQNYPDSPIKTLTIAGEKMTYYQKTSYQVFNGYGPTEFTVLSHVEKVTGEATRYSIGLPLDGVSDRIVDGSGKLSEIGELVLTGEQAAYGYLHDYTQTNRRFTKALDADGSTYLRSFKTSDKVERGADGKLYFLSRLDRQIKHSGYRIELEEIENAAIASSFIQAAACLYDGSRIKLYVIPKERYDRERLLRSLSGCLPDYAMPHRIFEVDCFPTNSVGKIDYEALAKLVIEGAGAQTEAAAAKPINPEASAAKLTNPEAAAAKPINTEAAAAKLTNTEKKLLQIILACAPKGSLVTGIDDNIINAGIDSLALIQIMLEVENKLGYQIQFADFFDHTTVRGLAQMLESGTGRQSAVRLREGEGNPLVLIFDMSRDILAYRLLLSMLSPGYPVYGISSTFIPPKLTLEEYSRLILSDLTQQGEYHRYDLVGYSGGGIFALEMAKQLGERAGQVFMIDTPNYREYPMRLNLGFLRDYAWAALANYGLKGALAYAKKYLRELTQKTNFMSESRKLKSMIREYETGAPGRNVTLFASSDIAARTDSMLGWKSMLSEKRIIVLEGSHASVMKKEAERIARIIEDRRQDRSRDRNLDQRQGSEPVPRSGLKPKTEVQR